MVAMYARATPEWGSTSSRRGGKRRLRLAGDGRWAARPGGAERHDTISSGHREEFCCRDAALRPSQLGDAALRSGLLGETRLPDFAGEVLASREATERMILLE